MKVNKINKKFSLFTFINNLQYLFKYRIKDIVKNVDLSHYAIEHLKYEIKDDLDTIFLPKIAGPFETIDKLITSEASICRFGDGEFLLMLGKDIPFQKADIALEKRLKEIFSSEVENILIGANFYLTSSLNQFNLPIKNWIRQYHLENWDTIKQFFKVNKQYYDAMFTQLNILYEYLDYEYYFDKLRDIWNDKKTVIICGEGIFNGLESNIFDNAQSINYQYAPKVNAFDDYENILKSAIDTDKNVLKIIILGPTATVLAYDLAKAGHRALDLGHVAKSYDWYCRNLNKSYSGQDCAKFFKPD